MDRSNAIDSPARVRCCYTRAGPGLLLRELKMTKNQIEGSRIKMAARLNEISGLEGADFTDAIRTESESLEVEYRNSGVKLAALLTVEDAERQTAEREAGELGSIAGSPEQRERLELRGKTGIADFLRAAAGGSAVTGAAAEYASSLGVPTTGHLPMALFGRSAPMPETRAITAAPAVDGPLQPTVPYVFERSAAVSLGIMMPSVPAGQVQIPKITTAPPSDTLAKDGSAPATAAAVSLVNQSPVRIAGSFEVRVEDLAVMPSLETALGESLQGSMSNELDAQIFSGAAGELNGLFVQAANVTAATAIETYTTGIARFASLVDGSHAYDLRDLRAVIGSKTFGLYSGLFANSGKGDLPLFDYLRSALGSIRVSDRVPGVSSTAQKGIVVLSAAAEAPKIHVWSSMQVVRDPYSGAGAGKVTLVATSLVSPLFVPHGVDQIKEINPKLS